ncbi:MAG: hypothetical protein WBO44_15700 [Saprospiraceae bacterium]
MAANGVVLAYIRKLYYTFTKNWFYIVLAFLTPMLLYYVSQGTEIIAILFDGGNFWNVFLILISFQLLFYAIWVIPPYSLSITRRLTNRKSPDDLFTKDGIYILFSALARAYNTAMDGKAVFPVRHFAGLPLLIFTLMLMESYLDTNTGVIGLIGFLILGLYLSKWTQDPIENLITSKIKKWPIEHAGYLFHFVFIVCIAGTWLIGLFWCSFILIILLYLINNAFYSYIERNSDLEVIRANYNANKVKYLIFSGLLLGFLLFFSWLTFSDHMHHFSSVIVMNVSFTVFIATIDLWIKTPNDAFKMLETDKELRDQVIVETKIHNEQKFVSKLSTAYEFFQAAKFVAIFGMSFYIFFDAFNKHRVRVESVDKQSHYSSYQRDSLKNYFKRWAKGIDSTKPIILVAGQGGGSRAGAWMVMNLDTLDKQDTSFVRNLFAISTVSGSSSGSNMMLNKWSLEQDGIQVETNSNLELAERLYTYNYLTAATWGMLWSDALRNLTTSKDKPARDRNLYRQYDEGRAFSLCYPKDTQEAVSKFFQLDLMTNWDTLKTHKRLPLLFLNTATTQAGKRAISAPVIIEQKIFGTAIDLYHKVKHQKTGADTLYNFPLVTAVNLSQAFPFVCAYNYVEGVGNMIDGGLYENSGCNTLFEIYRYLINSFPNLQYKILLIQNSNNDNNNTASNSSVLWNTITSAAASPFSGHSHYWEQNIFLMKRDTDTVTKIYPKIGCQWTDTPLGILLSKKSVDKLWEYVGKRD